MFLETSSRFKDSLALFDQTGWKQPLETTPPGFFNNIRQDQTLLRRSEADNQTAPPLCLRSYKPTGLFLR